MPSAQKQLYRRKLLWQHFIIAAVDLALSSFTIDDREHLNRPSSNAKEKTRSNLSQWRYSLFASHEDCWRCFLFPSWFIAVLMMPLVQYPGRTLRAFHLSHQSPAEVVSVETQNNISEEL